jgi:hypothetical protein
MEETRRAWIATEGCFTCIESKARGQNEIAHQEINEMRKALAAIVFATAAFCGSSSSYAQSAYDYPWCAQRYGRVGGESCYYRTYAQCMATISGIGGSCVRSPYYRGPAVEPRPYRSERYERY